MATYFCHCISACASIILKAALIIGGGPQPFDTKTTGSTVQPGRIWPRETMPGVANVCHPTILLADRLSWGHLYALEFLSCSNDASPGTHIIFLQAIRSYKNIFSRQKFLFRQHEYLQNYGNYNNLIKTDLSCW